MPPTAPENLLPYDGCLHNHGLIMSLDEAQHLYTELYQDIHWQPDQLIMFGQAVTTQRKVAWHADAHISYCYSGRRKSPQPWTPTLLSLKKQAETLAQTEFNACLLNLYHHGQEGMGWHSDNEIELGRQPVIASLSLGTERLFAFKHRHTHAQYKLPLASGQLIVMRGDTQQYWLHSLPKSRRVHSGRINLTFRQIMTP